MERCKEVESSGSTQRSPREFMLGRVVHTPGVLREVDPFAMLRALIRHANGDWGDTDLADRNLNDEAVETGGRVFSVFEVPSREKADEMVRIWVITEAEDDTGARQSTCILLPEEY